MTTSRVLTATVVTLAAAVLATSAVSIATNGRSSEAMPSKRVLLADYSLDTTSAQRLEALRIVGQMADLAAADRGLVAAAPFQASALATITWPILHRFRPKPSDPNSYYTKLDLRHQADVVKRQAQKLFARQTNIAGTDILGGLMAAGELLATEPSGPRVLVVASNMWAYDKADGLVLKYQAFTPAEITRFVNNLARSGKVAALRGVCVFVVGAGLDPSRQIPNATQISLRSFWKAYFARAGATVLAWTPTLSTEPSC